MLNTLSLACVDNNLAANFLSLFPNVKLSDFVLLNYLATTLFNLATAFKFEIALPKPHNIFSTSKQEKRN